MRDTRTSRPRHAGHLRPAHRCSVRQRTVADDDHGEHSWISNLRALLQVPIPLRHCPFQNLAEQHGEVICSVHLGLMQGALTAMRAPVTVDRLDPFVEPDLCVAHLAPAPTRDRASS